MFPSVIDLSYAILLALGVWWCKDVIVRFRSDLERFRAAEHFTDKAVIAFFWALTLGIIVLVVRFVWGLASRIAGAL